MGLTLYLDLMSQPSRAVLIFCRANNIPVEVKLVNLRKGEHRQPAFAAINPLKKVPAIDDSSFTLQESHAILRYLAATRPCSDHWYPQDARRRARIDAVLDWHAVNLRRGSAGLVLQRVLGPTLGLEPDPSSAAKVHDLLAESLHTMDSVWLSASPFLNGSTEPSIADLSLCCEIKQLMVLDEEEEQQLLDLCPKVRTWIRAVESSLDPHFVEAHQILYKASAAGRARRLQERTHTQASDGARRTSLVNSPGSRL